MVAVGASDGLHPVGGDGRKRLGLLLPHPNTVLEADLRVLPPEMIVHTQRWEIEERKLGSGQDELDRVRHLNDRLPEAIRLLPLERLDLMLYGCTTGSFLGGVDGMRALAAHIRDLSLLDVRMVAGALADVLRKRGLMRIALMTPYAPIVNSMMEDFFEELGFIVLQCATDPWFLGSHRPTGSEQPHEIADFVRTTLTASVDAVVLPCSAWRALEARAQLQEELDVPVITANQALALACLEALSIDGQVGALD